MLYLNKDYEVKVKKFADKETAYISIGIEKREVIIPLPKTFMETKVMKKGLYEDLTIGFTIACKPRINYGNNSKYIFALIDSKEDEDIDSYVHIEYEQFRATCIEKIISITSVNKDNTVYWESCLVKIPNNNRTRYIEVDYGKRKTYIVSELNDIYEINHLPEVLKENKEFMRRFDEPSDLRPLKEIKEEIKNCTDGYRKRLLQYIVDFRR